MVDGKYSIALKPQAVVELNDLTVFERRRIVDAMNAELKFQPTIETKRKKVLKSITLAGFDFDPPLWELKVGDFRVFYDVSEGATLVYIRAIRRKGTRTTEEVIR